MIKNFNKFKNTYYICTHSKSLKLHGIPPPPKMLFFNFSFALFISKLFINEDILKFYHGWVCQIPFKFHIRNRRNLFVASSTGRRRKSASTRFFSKKGLKVKIQNKFSRFFWIFLKERHSRTSCKKIKVVSLF